MVGRLKKFLVLGLLAAALVFVMPAGHADAASYLFKYTEVESDNTIKYNGKVPSYYVDGKLINTTKYPAIIKDGIAMCSTKLFEKIDEVDVDIDESRGQIEFTYYDKHIVMYEGSKTSYVDGKETTYSLAPTYVMYHESGKCHYLVPTRFVAENLGMTYTWHQDTSTVDIETPTVLLVNDEFIYYQGTIGKAVFNGTTITKNDLPVLIFSDNAMIPISALKKNIPGLRVILDEDEDTVSISYGEVSIDMTVNVTTTYINSLLDSAPYVPSNVYNFREESFDVYLPARYIFEAMNFDYSWNASKKSSIINIKEDTGTFNPEYDFALIVDPVKEYVYNGSFRQLLTIPIMDGIRTDLIDIHDDIYNNCVYFDLAGDFMSYYENHPIVNSGEAVQQVQVLYYEPEDITRIRIYTRTDKDRIILGHKDSYTATEMNFTFDKPKNLYSKIIILDAGHGGDQPGAIVSGIEEKNLNYNIICKYCKELFDSSDIKVYYTRTEDSTVTLNDRAELGARVGADFFISVHHNYNYNNKISGTEVYYSTTNTGTYSSNSYSTNKLDGRKMAELFSINLSDDLGTNRRGAIDHHYTVNGKANAVPAVLLEIGYMSNSEELKSINKSKFQKKVASSIYRTVLEIYNMY